MRDNDEIIEPVGVPRCLHGQAWNQCVLCARTTWCADCGDRVVLDEAADPAEQVTCSACVVRMITEPAVMVSGRYGRR